MKRTIPSPLALIVIALAVVAFLWIWQRNAVWTDDSLLRVQESEVLRVGSDIPFGVMEFFDENGQAVGIDVDIAKEIAARLGVELQYIDYDWDKLFPAVKGGHIDLAISGLTITSDRQEELLFSDPYFQGGQTIVVRSDNQDIKGINDLHGRAIAAQRETTSYDEALKYASLDKLFPFWDYENSGYGASVIDDLKDGVFEVLLVDYTEALGIIKENPDLKIVGVPFTDEEYGIVTAPGNDSLMEKVNSILQDMREKGVLLQIEEKWVNF